MTGVWPKRLRIFFGGFLQSSENVQNSFGKSSEIAEKRSEIFWKWSKMLSKWYMVVLFLCATWYLTSECSEQVRYWVEHSKGNSISVHSCILYLSAYQHIYIPVHNILPISNNIVKYIWNNSYLFCGCRWSEEWSSQ